MKKLLLNLLSLVMVGASMSAGAANIKHVRTAQAKSVATRAAVLPTAMTRNLAATYDPVSDEVADYFFIVTNSTEATWNKENGVSLKDGYVLNLDLYAATSNPVILPAGVYSASSSGDAMTYDPEYTYVSYFDANGNESDWLDVTGDIKVERDEDGTYTMSVDVLNGTSATTITFNGILDFLDGSIEPSVYNQIRQNLDLTFTGALGVYDGNLMQSNTGSMYINLYEKGYNTETGGMTEEGFSLALMVFGKLFSNSKEATLDPGTYTVARSAKRYTWFPGLEMDYMGMTVIFGSYAKEKNESRYSDGYGYGYLADGTIEIEDLGGGVFHIDVDCVTSTGFKVKGTYEGTIAVRDQSDDNKTGSHISSLEDDVQLNLDPIPCARAWNGGVVNGCQTFLVDIGSPAGRDDITEGDIMRIEFVLPGGTPELVEGTYSVMEYKYENYYEPYKLGQGRFVSMGENKGTDLSGTRYFHFEEGRYLIMDHLAPAVEGTVGASYDPVNDEWTFDIAVIDDANFRIEGSWTGPMYLMYSPDGILAAVGDVESDNENVDFKWLDNESVLVLGVNDASSAVVYNAFGVKMNCTVSGNVVNLGNLSSGIYLLNVNGKTLKIAKK